MEYKNEQECPANDSSGTTLIGSEVCLRKGLQSAPVLSRAICFTGHGLTCDKKS